MIAAVIVIGLVGYILDRLMTIVERNVHASIAFAKRLTGHLRWTRARSPRTSSVNTVPAHGNTTGSTLPREVTHVAS